MLAGNCRPALENRSAAHPARALPAPTSLPAGRGPRHCGGNSRLGPDARGTGERGRVRGANRSVVNITTEGVQGERIFMFEVPTPAKGEGSGLVIDRQGHILTNYHVIDGARQIQVTLFNGKSYDARLVGGDPATDVAVLRIDAPADVALPGRLGQLDATCAWASGYLPSAIPSDWSGR